jgi:hypothetical protein
LPRLKKGGTMPRMSPLRHRETIEINNKLFIARRIKMKLQKLILAVTLTGLVWSARAADVAGKWVGEFDTQVGHQKYTFNFQTADGKLQATADAESDQGNRQVKFVDVKQTGDTLTFAEMRQIQDNEVRIDYTGKVAANEIKFTRKVGDFGSTDFTAKPAGAAAPTTTAAATDAKDISGTWHAEFDTQIGMQKYDYTFKVADGKLTGKASTTGMDGEKRDTDLTEGKVSGDTVTFVEPLKFGDNDIRIEYTGKIKGDEITFKRKVGDFATEDLTAKRTAAK